METSTEGKVKEERNGACEGVKETGEEITRIPKNSTVEIIRFEDGEESWMCRTGPETLDATELATDLPNFVLFPKDFGLEKKLLVEIFREEPGINDPDTLYELCCEDVKILRARGILDKYVLNDEETSVLCAVTRLGKSGFDFNGLLQSCAVRTSEFVYMLLSGLRKLPWYKETLYFGIGSDKPIKERTKNELIRFPFCVGSSSIGRINNSINKDFKETFRVEDCWGYDVSDFDLSDDETEKYCNYTSRYSSQDNLIIIIIIIIFSFNKRKNSYTRTLERF